MKKRVAVIQFKHESNTFSVLPTDMECFNVTRCVYGADIESYFAETNTEIGGFLQSAQDFEWETVFILAADASPGGPVTEHALNHIANEVTRRLNQAGHLDGVFISLHGSMVTETSQDGETQFLKEIRSVIGNEIPLAVSLDLHANIFDEMAQFVDIAVSYKTYPHIDMASTARHACALLNQAMSGSISPSLVIARPPMLVGCDDGRTTDNGPMCTLLRSASKRSNFPEILAISINAGFTDSDVFAAGPSVIVCYDKMQAVAASSKTIAAELCDEIWELRDNYQQPISLQKCMDMLGERLPGEGPVVVADFSDNPGAGAYSDCTALIKALLDLHVENAAAGLLWDPSAVQQLIGQGLGAIATLSIGGKTDPTIGGGPLEVTGEIIFISVGDFEFEGPMFQGLAGKLGDCVNLRVAGLDILITSKRNQVYDKNMFRVLGVEPKEKSVLAVKSMQHFRAAFQPIARKIIVTDAGGLATPNIKSRTYTQLRRPIFPLDES